MYRILHEVAASGGSIPAGFVHVPLTPAQAVGKQGAASMDARIAARALVAIAEAACASLV